MKDNISEQSTGFFDRVQNHFLIIKLALIFILTILYILFFKSMSEQIGNGVAMLSLIPVLLIGLFFGLKTGIAGAIIFQLINAFLLVQFKRVTWIETYTTGIGFGGFALLAMGALVGYMSDLRIKLTNELKTRKSFEKELENQRTRVLEILNEQQDIVCRFTPDFHLTYINPMGANFLNKPADQLIGINFLTLFSESKRKLINNIFNHSESKNKTLKFEFQLTTHNQHKFFFQWVVTSIFDKNNNLKEFQAVGRDISESKKAHNDEHEQRQVIEALSNSAAILNSTLEIDEVLIRVLENISTVVPHDAANIMLVKNKSAKMVQLIGYEKFVEDMASFKNLEFPLTLPNFHQMLTSGRGLLIGNTATNPDWKKLDTNEWIGSYLGAPLIYKDILIGFLNLDSTRKDFYQDKHIDWLQAFADQAAIAIKNAQLFEETKERAKQLSLLNQGTRIAINAISIDEIKKPIADLISQLFSTDYVQISIWDEKQSKFNSYIDFTEEIRTQNFSDQDIELQIQLAKEIVDRGQIQIIEDAQNSEIIPQQLQNKIPLRTLVFFPLIVAEQKLGFILLAYFEKRQILSHELILLEQFARQTSLAISKTQMYISEKERRKKLSRTTKILSSISEIGATTNLDFNVDTLFQFVGEKLKKLETGCWIAFLDSNYDNMVVQYTSISKEPPNSLKMEGVAPKKRIEKILEIFPFFNDLVEKKQAFYFEDAQTLIQDFLSLQSLPTQEDIQNFPLEKHINAWFLPLIVNEQVLGIMLLWGKDIQKEDHPTFNLLTMQIATAIEKNKLYQKIQQLAITDSLTGLYNRRGLEELGKHEIERAVRFSRPLSALMIDIDKFKRVNDAFGHPVGDEILIQLARIMQSKLREVDILSRYGGEEFFILLPETNKEETIKIAERIRSHTQSFDFTTSAGILNITISTGICYLSENIANLDDMISAADQALYAVKNSGRNAIKLFKITENKAGSR